MTTPIIDDLMHVPNIIAALGIAIADAQAKLDQNYMASLERYFGMLAKVLSTASNNTEQSKQALATVETLMKSLAPSRYQFTETTLSVHLDLAQHLDVSGGLGASAGICGVAINAALSVGFSRDYRGAAECKTVLHAIPTDTAALEKVIKAAKEHPNALTLPALSKPNTDLMNHAKSLVDLLAQTTKEDKGVNSDSVGGAKAKQEVSTDDKENPAKKVTQTQPK